MTRPLIAYYGDDFTGSADVMEVLQWAGLRTVLFLEPPTAEQLDAFGDVRAFGVAGWSRTMSPTEMDAELKPALVRLRESGAAIVHYKTCSTFDSAPEIGSIGKALELGRDVFGTSAVPMVVAAPNLGRYQAFGNLFARSGLDTEPYRLDRHPTMRQHPITPMAEADLRAHLARQTNLKIGLFDVLQLNQPPPADEVRSLLARGHDALLFDVLYPDHLARVGAIVQAFVDQASPKFVVGSSGMEYALTEFWSQSGRLASLRSHPPQRPPFAATEQLFALTGSCSPVNGRQIAWAEQNGFETVRIDTARLIDPATREQEIACSVQRALDRIDKGANVIMHSSRGPEDPRVAEAISAFRALGFRDADIKLRAGRTLGPVLGKIVSRVLAEHRFARVAVAGGDTSGYVARELGITALEAIAPVDPGSPLCRASAGNALDGIEFFFKGGQVGKDNVWGTMLRGVESAG